MDYLAVAIGLTNRMLLESKQGNRTLFDHIEEGLQNTSSIVPEAPPKVLREQIVKYAKKR
jgi:hypothetical protein